MNLSTHILVTYKSQDSEILFRAGDGIAIGQRKKTVVVYGEDPNKKTSRVFIDSEHARDYLRRQIPQQDLSGFGVFARPAEASTPGPTEPVIDERDGETIIELAGNIVELPGGLRNFN